MNAVVETEFGPVMTSIRASRKCDFLDDDAVF